MCQNQRRNDSKHLDKSRVETDVCSEMDPHHITRVNNDRIIKLIRDKVHTQGQRSIRRLKANGASICEPELKN